MPGKSESDCEESTGQLLRIKQSKTYRLSLIVAPELAGVTDEAPCDVGTDAGPETEDALLSVNALDDGRNAKATRAPLHLCLHHIAVRSSGARGVDGGFYEARTNQHAITAWQGCLCTFHVLGREGVDGTDLRRVDERDGSSSSGPPG